jgi:hypothetical protein
MDPIFPQIPEDLGELSPEELESLIEQHRELANRIASEDAELLGDREPEAIIAELERGVEQVERLTAERDGREEAVAAYRSTVAELAGRLTTDPEASAEGDEGDEGDGDGEEGTGDAGELAASSDEPETVEEPEAETAELETVTAAAEQPRVVLRRPLPRPDRSRQPIAAGGNELPTLVASASVEGIREGTALDRRTLGELMLERRRRLGVRDGVREEVVVASAHWEYPEERTLHADDAEGNAAKIRAITDPAALVAAGGLCAPLTPLYDLPQISTMARPVRDALPAFMADRGGITWATPPSIADVTDAIGVITEADDAAGGTFAQKSCQVLECDPFNEQAVSAIYHCLQWGNMGARAWPERVAQFTDTVMAAHARLAEQTLLDLMDADSTDVTAAAGLFGYGALSNLTSQILVAAAGYRSRFRMAAESRFRVIFPAWVRDLLLSDLINSQFDRFALEGHAGVERFLRTHLIDPVWTLDGGTNDGSIFAAQGAGALLEFPDEVVWYLFPEGTWVYLDAGVLELGIIRDSVLNETNDFQVFGETFEAVARTGFQSLRITSEVCPTGETAGPADTPIPCTGT